MPTAAPTVLSEHPVSDAMRATILECLRGIEAEHHVRILHACESGSRGWGFASPDSDYDVRFVYVHRLDWYLTVNPGRDVIEMPISGELDVSGWDLRKALKLLHGSNPVLHEWLRSPIVYLQDETWAPRLRALAQSHLSPDRAYYHYLSMAKRNHREHLQGEAVKYKKYFYVMRPLLAARWIREGRGAPPMRFAELAQATLDDAALIDELNRLLDVKMRVGEAKTSPPWPGIQAFIDRELEIALAWVPPALRRRPMAELDDYLRECVLSGA
jgi:uncharacterized protein